MGYNGMPDGIGFKDEEMDWAREKKGIIICIYMYGRSSEDKLIQVLLFFIPVFFTRMLC